MGCIGERKARLAVLFAALFFWRAPVVAADGDLVETDFLAIVTKLSAGQSLTAEENARYSTELQRLIGKLANGQALTTGERAELKAMGQAGSSLSPAGGKP